MTDKQSNYLDMFQVVNAFHADNSAIINQVAARAAAFTLLSTRITAINALASVQSGNITGIAADKAALRAALNQLAFDHLTAALAWARNQSNNTLAAQFDHTLSDIQKIKDDTIVPFCQHRHQILQANIADLQDYGLLPASLSAWQTAMDAYTPIMAGPRSAKVSKSAVTAQLKSLFKLTNDHLRQIIDPLMLALRASQPQLYRAYKGARVIIDLRAGSRSTGSGGNNGDTNGPAPAIVEGTVLHASALTPVPGADVSLTVASATASGTTDHLGRFSITSQPITGHTQASLQVSSPQFIPYSQAITLTPRATLTEHIHLSPIPQPPAP